VTTVSDRVRDLDEHWRRLCRRDDLLSRLEPPVESANLVEAVVNRVQPGVDYPEVLLSSAAAGFGAASWRVETRVLVLQLGLLIEAASNIGDTRVDLLIRAQTVVCAAALQASTEAYIVQAETDTLTGLSNRRRYESRLLEEVGRIGLRLSVASIDLDGLKAVNDQHGHDVGDDYIRRFAGQLQGHCVEAGMECFRFGGDEFAVLSTELTEDEIEGSLLALRSEIDEIVPFSFGVVGTDDPAEFGTLISEADRRMYENKRGRKAEPLGEGGKGASGSPR
jgi:diguanylate cyclase (GGDEF)-like protein